MRSRLTVDSMYHVYTQEQNLQAMAKVAAELWESCVQPIEAARRDKKVAKMLDLATQMPHPQFAAFAQSIAKSCDARSKRKKPASQKPSPVPVPAVVTRETEMQRLTRHLDLQGIVLGGLCESLELETSDKERVWLYAQTRLVARMQQAGLPKQCEALVASFEKEGWQVDVLKQCVDWLNVGALNGLLAHVFAQLGEAWSQHAEDEKSHKAPAKLTVAEMEDLRPTRILLRVLGLAGLRELAAVPPDSPLEDALVARLKEYAEPIGDGIANRHAASQLHALFDAYEKEGEKAFSNVSFVGVQKQAARMYCRVIAFVQKQERAWTTAAKECMEAAALDRGDRKLAKHPRDATYLVERARALSDYRNDTQGALAVLDGIPKADRDGTHARERGILLGKMGRFPEMLHTLDRALASPDWSDLSALAKLFCLRAEARIHTQDALGAWADARRATLIAPSLPRLADLNSRVLGLLEKDWEDGLSAALEEAQGVQAFRFHLAKARSALLHERWEDAVKIGQCQQAQSPRSCRHCQADSDTGAGDAQVFHRRRAAHAGSFATGHHAGNGGDTAAKRLGPAARRLGDHRRG